MLHFGVTIPATVPQRSEIPDGLMNYPILRINWMKTVRSVTHTNRSTLPAAIRFCTGIILHYKQLVTSRQLAFTDKKPAQLRCATNTAEWRRQRWIKFPVGWRWSNSESRFAEVVLSDICSPTQNVRIQEYPAKRAYDPRKTC